MDISITSEALAQAMIDGIRQPMLAVDAHQRVLLRNRRAAELLGDATLVRQDTQGRFRACCLENDALLATGFNELAPGSGQCGWGRLRGAEHAWTSMLLRRVPDAACEAIAVTIFESPSEEDGTDRLAAAFGLTPAEARVAGYVAHGLAPKEVAARCGVSPCTVRSQLRTLFAKTGARRQPELVRILLLTSTL